MIEKIVLLEHMYKFWEGNSHIFWTKNNEASCFHVMTVVQENI